MQLQALCWLVHFVYLPLYLVQLLITRFATTWVGESEYYMSLYWSWFSFDVLSPEEHS